MRESAEAAARVGANCGASSENGGFEEIAAGEHVRMGLLMGCERDMVHREEISGTGAQRAVF